jgi:hypothetical protein
MLHKTSKQNKNKLLLISVLAVFMLLKCSGYELYYCIKGDTKGFWRWSVSLYGSSVKRTLREGSLAGDPGG